jgi:hypothetical protein
MENKFTKDDLFKLKCKQTAELNEELQCILHSVPRLSIVMYVNECQRHYYTVSIEHAILLAKRDCIEAGWTKCEITAIEIHK